MKPAKHNRFTSAQRIEVQHRVTGTKVTLFDNDNPNRPMTYIVDKQPDKHKNIEQEDNSCKCTVS